jgi:hypothetical protein
MYYHLSQLTANQNEKLIHCHCWDRTCDLRDASTSLNTQPSPTPSQSSTLCTTVWYRTSMETEVSLYSLLMEIYSIKEIFSVRGLCLAVRYVIKHLWHTATGTCILVFLQLQHHQPHTTAAYTMLGLLYIFQACSDLTHPWLITSSDTLFVVNCMHKLGFSLVCILRFSQLTFFNLLLHVNSLLIFLIGGKRGVTTVIKFWGCPTHIWQWLWV